MEDAKSSPNILIIYRCDELPVTDSLPENSVTEQRLNRFIKNLETIADGRTIRIEYPFHVQNIDSIVDCLSVHFTDATRLDVQRLAVSLSQTSRDHAWPILNRLVELFSIENPAQHVRLVIPTNSVGDNLLFALSQVEGPINKDPGNLNHGEAIAITWQTENGEFPSDGTYTVTLL